MKYAIIDFMNLAKRYLPYIDTEEIDIETSVNILNKIINLTENKDYNLVIITCDKGRNKRAIAISGGMYKANRNRAKGGIEEGFIKSTKDFIKTTPYPFIEIQDVEADMIIYVLNNYIKKIDNECIIDIYSTDTDFIQLIDKNINLYDWSGKITDISNWYVKNKKLKGNYFNSKHYALAKSITGDISDNVKISNNYGWGKLSKLFNIIYSKYGKDVDINNVYELINIISEIKDSIDKKDKIFNFINNTLVMLINNKDLINKNQSIIDLSMCETPFIFKIMTNIKEVLTNSVSFQNKNFIDFLKLKRFSGEDCFENIKVKNSKNMYILYKMDKKFNNTINTLKNKQV